MLESMFVLSFHTRKCKFINERRKDFHTIIRLPINRWPNSLRDGSRNVAHGSMLAVLGRMI